MLATPKPTTCSILHIRCTYIQSSAFNVLVSHHGAQVGCALQSNPMLVNSMLNHCQLPCAAELAAAAAAACPAALYAAAGAAAPWV
jgi:hypothetical protein